MNAISEQKQQNTGKEEQKPAEDAAKPKDFGELVRENEMLRVKLDQTLKMLKEATEIIKKINAERDAVQEARKYELAVELERDTDGRFKTDDLMKESLETLTIMKKAVDTAKPKQFPSVNALEAAEERKQLQLSVGEWDPVTKQWKGGR